MGLAYDGMCMGECLIMVVAYDGMCGGGVTDHGGGI